jgi:hypothetical protein
MTTSFNLDTLFCNTCTGIEHRVLHREKDLIDVKELVLPVEGDRECLKILRIEHGSLMELVEAFLEATKGFIMPAGSVVVLASASHLAWVGTAAYIAEFVRARARILGAFRNGLEVVHGVPVSSSGIGGTSCIRALLEVTHWLASVQVQNGRDIDTFRIKFVHGFVVETGAGSHIASAPGTGSSLTSAAGSGSMLSSEPLRLMLPDGIDSKVHCVFESNFGKIPSKIEPFDNETINAIVCALIDSINEKFMTELAYPAEETATGENTAGIAENFTGKRFVVVCASHAGRIADCIDNQDVEVVDLSVPGWTVTEKNVAKMTAELEKVLNEKTDLISLVIYQIFDNSIYFAEAPDGKRSLPVKSKDDGKYHVPGRLVLADRAAFKSIFRLSVPLFRAGAECEKIIISPLPRLMKKGCCADPGHVTNRTEKQLIVDIGEGLSNIKTWIKELTFGKRIRNFKVLCPMMLLEGDSEAEDLTEAAMRIRPFWNTDPVHMTSEGYRYLTVSLLETVAGSRFTRGIGSSTEVNPEVGGHRGGRGRIQVHPPAHRESWVSSDDATAVRVGEATWRGAWRPRRGHSQRGGWKTRGRGRGHYTQGGAGGYGKRSFYRPY